MSQGGMLTGNAAGAPGQPAMETVGQVRERGLARARGDFMNRGERVRRPGVRLSRPPDDGADRVPEERLAHAWRQDFIQTFLQRDLPQMDVGVAADALHRFWRMLAHLQGQLFNASQLGLSLGGASHSTATRYLDLLVDTMLVRRLEPHLPEGVQPGFYRTAAGASVFSVASAVGSPGCG